MSRYFGLLTGFVFYAFFAFSQGGPEKQVIVVGKVHNEQNAILPGANIIAIENKTGTTSDKDGLFRIKASTLDTLRISFVGYKPELIPININPAFYRDTVVVLNVILKKDPFELREAVVYSKREPELLYGIGEKQRDWVYDYMIKGDEIWMLSSLGKAKILIILSTERDTLSKYFKLRDPKGFHKDCYSNVLILFEHKVLWADFENEFFIRQELTLPRFENTIKPVLVGNHKFMFVKDEMPLEGRINFIQIDLEMERDWDFYTFSIEDYLLEIVEENNILNKALDAMARNHAQVEGGSLTQAEVAYYSVDRAQFDDFRQEIMLQSDLKLRREFRANEELYRNQQAPPVYPLPSDFNEEVKGWFNSLLMKPKFCPLVLKNDTVFIFNHVNDSLHIFSIYGERLHSSYISYNVRNAKEEEIILDEVTGRIYYKYLLKGTVYLKEIDVFTGRAVRDYKIENMLFPEKVSVDNDYVYFLHKDKNEMGKRLYRLTLN